MHSHSVFDPSSSNSQFVEKSLFDTDQSIPSVDHLEDINIDSEGAPRPTFQQAEPFSSAPRYRMNITNPFNSVLTMPIPGTKLAPEKFRGDFHKVKEFIQHYERLCAQNNVSNDTEKCDTLLRYCSKREKQTIKNMSSFWKKSWGCLREDILRLYDADLDTRRYKVKDVRNFSKKQKVKKIRDLAAWKKYCRAFLRIAGSLLAEGKISDKEYAIYFWQGIPKLLRIRLENRILAKNPIRDLSEPFEAIEIDTAASAVLQRDRFDRAFDDSDSDSEGSSVEESSSESDDESSDSESEDEKEKRRRRLKKKLSHKRSSSREEKNITSKKRTVSAPQREVESLIKQMNLLTQDDPQYGIAYYRALKLDPDVAKIVSEPAMRRTYDWKSPPQKVATYQQTIPNQTMYAPRPSNSTQAPPPRGSEIICYGCGEKGHGMNRCPSISELISQGILTRDQAGRVVYQDGSSIRRYSDETFIQAYEREQRVSSHYISIVNDHDQDSPLNSDNEVATDYQQYDSDVYYDSDYEDVFAIRDVGWRSYAADRPEKKIAARQKMVMDGVYPPRLKDLSAGKENRPADPETGRPIRPGKGQAPKPRPPPVIKEILSKPKNPPETIPVEVHKPRFDASNDTQIIEDKHLQSITNQIRPQNELPKIVLPPDKRPQRKSAVSEHVNSLKVLDQVLNAKVELAVGEIIGVSRELSGQLAEVIKYKPAKQVQAVGLSTTGKRAKTRGLLIKVTMECDGNPIEAIIDTGSQLNIVSEKICKSKIRRPIDYSASINMNDANGGEKKLNGIVENVPFEFGSVRTRANLYVGAHVPFDLLLGRPWQRGNLVSIDELEDGTYLVFKDPESKEPRKKVLVTPDANIPDDWDFDPSTWYVPEENISYYIDCTAQEDDRGCAERPDGASNSEIVGHMNPQTPRNASYLEGRVSPHSNSSSQCDSEFGISRLSISESPNKEIIETLKRSREFRDSSLKVENLTSDIMASSHTQTESTMEIRLGPAKVQHENELVPLCSGAITQSDAQALLTGLGEASRFPRSHHLRDIVLTSHDGIVLGHLLDNSGFRRTDLMLFNMGLVTPRDPSADLNTTDLDVQYGTGLVHFYPNLGQEAPPDWTVPYLFPIPFKSPADSQTASSLGLSPPVRPASPISFSDPESSESSDDELEEIHDEVDIPCVRCLDSVDFTCAATTTISISRARLPTDCREECISNRSYNSLPSLINVSDSGSDISITSDGVNFNIDRLMSRWDEFKNNVRMDIDKHQDDWKKGWDMKGRAASEGKTSDTTSKYAPMSRSTDRLTLSAAEDSSPRAGKYIGISSPPSTPSRPLPTIVDPRYPMRLRDHVNSSQDGNAHIPPIAFYPPAKRPDLTRIRRVLARKTQASSLPRIEVSEETGQLVEGDDIKKSILFAPPPVQVFSVHIPPPSFETNATRPPTPFPIIEQASAHLALSSNDSDMDEEIPAPCKPPNEHDESPPRYGQVVTLPHAIVARAPLDSSGLPRLAFATHPVNTPLTNGDTVPSPSDTEPVEYYFMSPRRREPRPPVFMRADYYRQAHDDFIDEHPSYPIDARDPMPCFRPHIAALSRDRVFFPFIETNRPGPRTDSSIPIEERIYYPYADLDVHYNIPRAERLIRVDLRSLTIISDQDPVPAGLSAMYTVLAPHNTSHGLVLPGLLWPNSFGPLDLPHVVARTLGERFRGLCELRKSIMRFIVQVRQMLTPWQITEANSAFFTLFALHGTQLVETRVNRAMFFRIIHPTFNPLITRVEAVFLRGVCYIFRQFQQYHFAETIDLLLRSPQLDEFMCRSLLELGCLDKDGKEEEAYHFFQHYEDAAQGDAFFNT
jgi:hypothetical protein